MAYLTPNDIRHIPFRPADHRIHYGENPYQFGDLRLPNTSGPHPILVVIHGRCWISKIADVNFMSAFAESFTEKSLATWNIEYRCTDVGGGWPGTFQDVGQAVDHLKALAPLYNLDLRETFVVGHSAGGHLALWVGARHRLSPTSVLYKEDSLPVKGIINLSGPGDLRLFAQQQNQVCGTNVIDQLLGSSDSQIMGNRYTQISPYELLPLGIKQILITGKDDRAAPPESLTAFAHQAKTLGDDLETIIIEDAGHFEVIAPTSPAWPIIKQKILSLFVHL